MKSSRSKFYVDTPLDPPSQRHSMFADNSELVHRLPPQDLSSASSSTTLPSTAGSVDRLTGLGHDTKKKSHRFFTLRPKTSFPFFSSTSSLSPSTSSSKKQQKNTSRQLDSCVQTEKKSFDEVGVQTLNASTVDVPVQTCFDEWDHSYGIRRPYAATAHRPVFPRGPSGGYYANQDSAHGLRPTHAPVKHPVSAKQSFVSPLDTSKVLKYASPLESSPAGTSEVNEAAAVRKVGNSSEGVDKHTPISSAVKCLSTTVPTNCDASTPETPVLSEDGISSGTQTTEKEVIQVDSFVFSPTVHHLELSEYVDSVAKSDTSNKKPTAGSEVSAKSIAFTHFPDRPSALKIERSDSPVKHTAKIKTVHFDLSEPNESHTDTKSASPTNSQKESKPNSSNNVLPRNIDKDFEDLLRNLDILVDDPTDSSSEHNTDNLKITFNSFQNSPPKQTLLSTKLKSAFDVLSSEALPPILETIAESSEIETPNVTIPDEADKIEPERIEESVLKISPVTKLTEDIEKNKLSTPTNEQHKVDPKSLIDDSGKPTSLNTFASSKLDSCVEKEERRDSVYDSGITENVIKTVTLPTLPSFFDSALKCNNTELQPVVQDDTISDTPPVQQTPLRSDSEEKMLSRSSSRSSVRSDHRSDYNTFLSAAGKFDSCENLDQLEEEIIRSLCEPDPSVSESNHDVIPITDGTHVRRKILDRLLSGESEGVTHSNRSSLVQTPDELIEVPESKVNARQSSKHIATLTKYEQHRNKSPIQSSFFPSQINSNNSDAISHTDTSGPRPVLTENKAFSNSPFGKIESTNKNSVFCFPEYKPLSTGVAENVSTSLQEKDKHFANNLKDPSFKQPTSNFNRVDSDENNATPGDSKTEACDFTHCLRPSEIHKSSFIDKINSTSVPSRSSPEKSISPVNVSIAGGVEIKGPNSNGQCDFANCLKPSQVQNSVFTAELSEITSNKSCAGEPLHTNSPLTSRTTNNSSVYNGFPGKMEDTLNNANEVSHKSEVTIVLQSPRPVAQKIEVQTKKFSDEFTEEPPVYTTQKEAEVEKSPQNTTLQEASILIDNITQQPSMSIHPEPNPPPPPPPPTFKQGIKNNCSSGDSLQSVIQTQKENLLKSEPTPDPKYVSNKSPVMMELERRFETHRRHSSDELLDQRKYSSASDFPESRSNISPDKRYVSNENSFVSHHSPSATTYQCNGSNGSSFQHRDYTSHNIQKENGFTRREVYSPTKTFVTDEPPPPGAVLLDKKITVEGDKVHTDKYYAIPVKEVLKETTTTTKFIPAPPKYEGIGPTEDGVPIAPRNSVKKENMHNWYKTMFKSLHKADSSNDNQEYIIGYSSEPETSKKEKALRKKCSTLDNRSGNSNLMKTNDHLSRQPYPPSAKSSIDVYNVRPRLIEDYEPGHSSVTDDEITIGYKRHLPALNTPKPSYEFKNGYEQDNNFIRNLSTSDGPDPEQQKVWYKEIQKGGEIPQYGLGKPAPEKPKDPVIGPLPPPPLNYNGPTIAHQATRPLTLPPSYQTDNGLCQQSNGPYEMHMRQVIHSELHQRISPSSSQLSSPSRSILKSPSRSPDLQIPARVLFDFKAETVKEIPLKKDDIVLILRQLDKNWYEGEHYGRVGIFPINYVEIVPPEHASTPIKTITHGSGKVLYDFTAHTSVELSVRKGDLVILLRRVDNNWYEARFTSKKGIIPASYLQVIQEPIEKITPSSPSKPCLRSPRSSSETRSGYNRSNLNSLSPSFRSTSPSKRENDRGKFEGRGKKSSSLIEPVMYRALYSYSPMNSDELELMEGDTIYVVEMCDDGWYVGTSVRTGVFGIFPGNYVEKS